MSHIADRLTINFHSTLLDQAIRFRSRRHAPIALKNLRQLNPALRSHLMLANFLDQFLMIITFAGTQGDTISARKFLPPSPALPLRRRVR